MSPKVLNKPFVRLGALTSVLLALSGCGGGSCNSCNGQPTPTPTPSPIAVDFQIDYIGTVPVMNGNATSSLFYVHNDGDTTLTNITYTLAGAVKSSKSAVPKATGDVEDDRGFILNGSSLTNCASIPAHSSCAIEFTTPVLSVSNQNNSLVIVNIPDANGFNHQFDQVVNYSYYSSSVLTGVDFVGAANVISSLGNKRYVMGYLAGGSATSVSYDDVNLQFSMDGILSVNQGFVNGQQIGMNEVVPVEFNVQQSSSNPLTPISIVPQYIITSVAAKQSSKAAAKANQTLKAGTVSSGQGLFVNTSTDSQNVGLGVKLGSIPFLSKSIPTTVYVSSFGPVSNLQVSPDNANVSVTNNTCTSGIESNASCSFVLTANSDAVGQTLINFTLPDTGEQIYNQDVNFGPVQLPDDTGLLVSNSPVGLVGLIANQQTSPINFVFSNIGNTVLNELSFSPITGAGVQFQILSNNCGASLAVNSQCVVQVVLVAGNGGATGNVYLQANARTGTGKPYTSNSSLINYTVESAVAPYFSAPTGGVTTLVVSGDGRESQTAQFTLSNPSSSAQTINGVSLTGLAVPTSLTIESNTCNGSLSSQQTCTITVKYGPMLLESNVNGVANLIVNYGESLTVSGTVNYSGLGMDSALAVTNVVASGFINGGGTSDSPYFARGCLDSIPTLTITYTNLSRNFTAQNLALDTINGNISPYMNVESSLTTCGYGANPKNLAATQSCNLVLVTNKAKMNNASSYNLNVIYPSATWQTTSGFIKQTNFIYNGSNTVYAGYVQPELTSNVTPSSGYQRTRTLTQSMSNAEGCGDISTMASSLYRFGVTATPVVANGDCLVNSDLSVTCTNNTTAATNQINYTLPDVLPADVNMFFLFNSTTGTQMYFNPALLIFSVESSLP